MYREDYLFVKAEINADRTQWCGTVLPDLPSPPAEEPGKKRRGRLRRRREARAARREYERRQLEYNRAGAAIDAGMLRLAGAISEAVEQAGALGEISCVYEGELGFLSGEEGLAGRWRRFWNVPEFRDYREFRWVKPLLQQAEGPYFILLGTASCVPRLLQDCARRMKSLGWYLSEEDCTEEIREFAEDFYEEYGLAVTLTPLTGEKAFRRLRLESKEPVCVLDFTEEEKVFGGGLAAGSLWLDFTSAEEKGRRLKRLSPGVRYDSMKQRWRGFRRNEIRSGLALLDSGEKNGYNTFGIKQSVAWRERNPPGGF